jgi:hypothetical protein
MESGIDRHWDNLEQGFIPLVFRAIGFAFNQEIKARKLSLYDLNWSIYLFLLGLNVALISLLIEIFYRKFSHEL